MQFLVERYGSMSDKKNKVGQKGKRKREVTLSWLERPCAPFN
uniref:Uncharacterized protein n=1 Tax=Rhizophora mucronata TaxID=61149 RepID=A0A2P2N140_RHIMU